MHSFLLVFCILHSALCIGSCSLPSLESGECSQARDTVKQFYSWYLGTETGEKDKHPEIFNKYVSSEFLVGHGKSSGNDPYFLSPTFPKTFKIGVCKQIDAQKVDMQVQLYWRDDAKTVQKEVHVETVKASDKWLINKISN
jgi:hypothetical protein